MDHYGKEIAFLYSEDEIRIVDFTHIDATVELSVLEYDYTVYAHQGWIDCGMTTLVVDDELDEETYHEGYPYDFEWPTHPDASGPKNETGRTRTFIVNVVARAKEKTAGERLIHGLGAA